MFRRFFKNSLEQKLVQEPDSTARPDGKAGVNFLQKMRKTPSRGDTYTNHPSVNWPGLYRERGGGENGGRIAFYGQKPTHTGGLGHMVYADLTLEPRDFVSCTF